MSLDDLSAPCGADLPLASPRRASPIPSAQWTRGQLLRVRAFVACLRSDLGHRAVRFETFSVGESDPWALASDRRAA